MERILRWLFDGIVAPVLMYAGAWIAGTWWVRADKGWAVGFIFSVLINGAIAGFSYKEVFQRGAIERGRLFLFFVYLFPLLFGVLGSIYGLIKLIA